MSRRRSNERLSESAAQRRAAEGSVRARPGERAREAELLSALRENQRVLRELAYAFRMPHHLACSPTSMSGVPAISCPHDVVKILG